MKKRFLSVLMAMFVLMTLFPSAPGAADASAANMDDATAKLYAAPPASEADSPELYAGPPEQDGDPSKPDADTNELRADIEEPNPEPPALYAADDDLYEKELTYTAEAYDGDAEDYDGDAELYGGGAYLILYADGVADIQTSETPQSGKTVKKVYPIDLSKDYGSPTPSSIPWYSERTSVRVVNFRDPISPVSTADWFYNFSNLERVENISNLDTSNVTTMWCMFSGCENLTELDVSSFNTSNVTNMLAVFSRCTKLTSLNISGWDTSKVTNMQSLFRMLPLTELDLSEWDTSKLTNTNYMFEDCSKLKTIYVSDKFTVSAVTESSSMFGNCAALVGGNGTKYDSSHVDKAYARLDTASAPGYFTAKGEQSVPVPDGVFAILYDDGTLVFQKGNVPESGRAVKGIYAVDMDKVYGTHEQGSESALPWYSGQKSIRVVSFKDKIQPIATLRWFRDCSNLERVENARNLDTSRTTTTYHMFYGCTKLKEVDVSGWDTSNMEDMCCTFYECPSLEAVDVSGWNTSNITDIRSIFYNCASLKELDVSGWDTSNMEEMQNIFYGCSGLTTLDLSGWNTAKAKDIWNIFYNCSKLKTIYASDKFSVPSSASAYGMFSGCSSLVGGNGTKYDSSHVDKAYARLDTASAPGYFTAKGEQSVPVPDGVFAILYDDGTLVFQNGNVPESGRTVKGTYAVDMNRVYGSEYFGSESEIPWYSAQKAISVVSFKDKIRPIATQRWFYECSNLERVENIQNLDTSRVTKMRNMFWGCRNLEAVDVSGWDTSQCTDMTGIFLFCGKIRELDVSGWDTSNAKLMGWIFADCSGLTTLNLSGWNTANVTDMVHMFRNCSGLTELDLSAFNTAKVTDMNTMFSGCSKLATIRVSDQFKTSAVTSSSNMFDGCTALVGGAGTKYNSSHMDKTYARIDTASAPGYFTSNVPVPVPSDDVYAILYDDGMMVFQKGNVPESGKTVKKSYKLNLSGSYSSGSSAPWYSERATVRVVSFKDRIQPTSTAYWFHYCTKLERVDNIRNLDTSGVTNMKYMFCHCEALKSLDVSSFDTSKVTSMWAMFSHCTSLTALDASSWNVSNVTETNSMFGTCSGLETLKVSGWDTAKITDMGGMFGHCQNLTELDVSSFDTSKVTNMTNMFWYSSKLKTLYASDKFKTDAVTKSENMFLDCTSLVGGAGTKYDSSHKDKAYARIDTSSAPGYFTSTVPPVPTTYYTVTWKNGDTVLKTDRDVPAGTTPVYSGETPVKPGQTFAGWTPEPAPISADVTYTARFKPDGNSFDVKKDAYSFGNSAKDFGYTSRGPGVPGYPIPADSVFLIFGNNMLGKMTYIRVASEIWNGNCAGMSGSVALFYANKNVNPKDFGKDDVWSLKISDSNGKITVLTFIEAMQVAQYTDAFAKSLHDHSFRPKQSLMPLAQAVRAAAAQGRPTLIAISKEKVGGHALLAVGVEELTDNAAKIQIYDCNHPGELQYLTIRNASEWSYDMGPYGVWGDKSDKPCSIGYVPYETLESIWENRGRPRAMNEALTVNVANLSVTNYLDEEIAQLVDGRLVTSRDDVYEVPMLSIGEPAERTIFLPKDVYTLTAADAEAELKASMTDQRMSASITTSANSVSFAVDDASKLNAVTVKNASESDTYSISMETDFEDIDCKSVTLEGAGQGQTFAISMNPEGPPTLSNCNVASLSINGEEQETYVITSSAGQGGSVVPSGKTSVPSGTDRTFTFTPNAGYKVQTVQVDGEDIGPRSEYAFRNVTAEHTLTVLFERDADAPAISAARDGNALKVTLTNPDGATVAVSYFDEAGKFVSTDMKPGAESLTFPLPAASTARVMLFDADYRPLCDPLNVPLSVLPSLG